MDLATCAEEFLAAADQLINYPYSPPPFALVRKYTELRSELIRAISVAKN
jgi:hypothetical protein